MKVVYCLAIGLFLSTGGILLQQSPSPLQQPTASEKQRIKNERLVRKHFRDDIESAKEADRKEVVLPGIIEMPIVTPSMSDIANKYSLLRVRVITKETIVSDHTQISIPGTS
jgi:2-hydroxy-3-keto-5-methylthiopentenyl-1-phosphate phosphatase